jgi:hypothetical protein
MPEPILHEPAAIFMTLMAVILIAPLLTKRVNLPGIVGLILGGHGMSRSMAELLDLPLHILATSHYIEDLQQEFGDSESEIEVAQIGSVGGSAEAMVEDIVERLDESDHVIITSMGSHDRFNTGEEKIPQAFVEQFSGSFTILHTP